MVAPIALAGVSAGLSLLGGIAGNSAISKAAKQQYGANKLFIERDQAIANQQNEYVGDEINNEIGMALTDLLFQSRKAQASTAARQASTQIYGNTAVRQQIAIQMKEALTADSLAQAAEAKMLAVQNKFSDIKYATEAKHAQNLQSYNNMMSQQQSTFNILTSAATAGLSGYSSGLNLEADKLALDIAKRPL